MPADRANAVSLQKYALRDPEVGRQLIDEKYTGHRPRLVGDVAGFRFDVRVAVTGAVTFPETVHSPDAHADLDPIGVFMAPCLPRGRLTLMAGREEVAAGPNPGRFAADYRQAYGVHPSQYPPHPTGRS
jgi:hypothetical protein